MAKKGHLIEILRMNPYSEHFGASQAEIDTVVKTKNQALTKVQELIKQKAQRESLDNIRI